MLATEKLAKQIATVQRELNELVHNAGNRNSEMVLEKSKILDELIVAYYDLKKNDKCNRV